MNGVLRRWLGRTPVAVAVATLAASGLSTAAQGVELVNNGSFETNGGTGSTVLNSWTSGTLPSSQGTFYAQSGVYPTFSRFIVEAPSRGSFAAMTDQIGPGTTVLYQDIAVPAAGQTVLSLRLSVLNQAEDYASPASLDYAVVPNQQARVDIVNPAASVLDVGAGVLANMFRTMPGDPQVQGYITLTQNLTPFAGTTVRLRVASVDNQQGLNVGVDAVSTQLCDLDIDSDGQKVATTDALLIIRQLLGFSGAPLINGAVTTTAPLAGAARVNSLVSAMRINGSLDIDGNGVIDSQSDGLLILRAMLGFTGTAVTNGALGNPPRTRGDWASIRAYLNSQCGMNLP